MLAWVGLALVCTEALVGVACIGVSLLVGTPAFWVAGALAGTWAVSSVGVGVCTEAFVVEGASSEVGVVACTEASLGEVVSSVGVGHS